LLSANVRALQLKINIFLNFKTRSLKFERKLLSLKWRRESPRKKTNNSLLEWQKIERINISSLFIEGINNELNVGNLKKEILVIKIKEFFQYTQNSL